MTRSFALVNTSNWSDEPLRYDLGEGIGGELKAGEVSCGIALQGPSSDGDVRLTVKGTLSDKKPAPVYNQAGVQMQPRVCVMWLPEGAPSWKETAELLDNARGEIRRLEAELRTAKGDNAQLMDELAAKDVQAAEQKVVIKDLRDELEKASDDAVSYGSKLVALELQDEDASLAEMNVRQSDTIRDLDQENKLLNMQNAYLMQAIVNARKELSR